MKKGFTLGLALLLVCFLASCGKKGEGDTSGVFAKFEGDLETNVKLRVLENDTAIELGYFDELINAFNATYEEYGIEAVDAKMDQYSDLENDGPYGYGPDVLYQANDVLMKYVEGRHILPLPTAKLTSYSSISKAAWQVFESNEAGELYTFGVPVNIQSPMLYYRKDMLPSDWQTNWDNNHNNVPDMVESWSYLYKYSKEIHANNPKKYGYMKSLFDSYFSIGYLLSYDGYIFGDNNKNTQDIGLDNGDSYKGAKILKQLASIMSEECIDDTITTTAYSRLASGEYFATMTTPDVYELFINELTLEYKRSGLSESESQAKAIENLVITNVPELPESATLEDTTGKTKKMTVMGGIHGYAISSYTKAPKAALAFINFATSYEMMKKRTEMLSIAPVRMDIINDTNNNIAKILFDNLENGYIDIMPSIKAVGQIWTPLKSLFTDLAKDPYREAKDQYFITDDDYKNAIVKTKKDIYDAIFALAK